MRTTRLNKGTSRALFAAGIVVSALALSAGGALAGNGNQGKGKGKGKAYGKAAAAQCAKERKSLGKAAFAAIYGKPAIPRCIGVTKPEVAAAAKNAAKDCKAERNDPAFAEGHDGKSFGEFYGNNKNGKNAFGKCVSGKAKAELRQDRQETVNAAQACKAEREDPAFAEGHDGKSFGEFYGNNKNGKNAFGKCVSGKAAGGGS